MKYQGVDENDIETGPLREEDLPSSIHRRVALLLVDENSKILVLKEADGWTVPHTAVPYRQSSEATARNLLQDLGYKGALRPLGGILQRRDQYSTQTHVFLVRWDSRAPLGHEEWEAQPVPLPSRHTGSYRSFINEALPGRPRSMRIQEDLRSS